MGENFARKSCEQVNMEVGSEANGTLLKSFTNWIIVPMVQTIMVKVNLGCTWANCSCSGTNEKAVIETKVEAAPAQETKCSTTLGFVLHQRLEHMY